MPVSEREVSQTMQRLALILENLKDRATTSFSEEPLLIGKIKDFTKSEISLLLDEKIYFAHENIYLSSNETDVHLSAAYALLVAFENIPTVAAASLAFRFKYVDKFRCGHVYHKRADIYLLNRRDRKPLVPIEIAFTNENFGQFLIEGLNYLNEFSTANYFIGMKVMPRRQDFLAYFVVLKRTLTPLTDEIQKIEKELFYQKYYEQKEYCQEIIGEPQISDDFFQQNGAELVFSRTINDINYAQDFQFTLEGPLIHSDIEGLLTITVQGHYISLVRDDFYVHRSLHSN